jgi:hypothetical protein
MDQGQGENDFQVGLIVGFHGFDWFHWLMGWWFIVRTGQWVSIHFAKSRHSRQPRWEGQVEISPVVWPLISSAKKTACLIEN